MGLELIYYAENYTEEYSNADADVDVDAETSGCVGKWFWIALVKFYSTEVLAERFGIGLSMELSNHRLHS